MPRFADSLTRRALFGLDPERAHNLALGALGLCQRVPGACALLGRRFGSESDRLRQHLLGRDFPNPIGLAAGFDKNGAATGALAALGFGFLEIGTVTPRPQPGNPRPRMFRYPEAESLQNALGFNNAGMLEVGGRLYGRYPLDLPLGVNIGKNKATPIECAEEDYELLLGRFADICDYLVINVSSPNTPGLRDLQSGERLAELLARGREMTERPILIKLAPDLDPAAAAALAVETAAAGAGGIVLTNTTTDYSLLEGARPSGGLSGRVLRERSFRMLQAVAAELFGECPLISVGGIDSGAEAYRRLRAGASLAQVYTGLVFGGPGLVGSMLRDLLSLLDRDGFASIGEAVGADLKGEG